MSILSDNATERRITLPLIIGLVNSVKRLNGNKVLVLVIDDLDRIDPEPIFRIVNVFFAHLD